MTKLKSYMDSTGQRPRELAALVGCDRTTILRIADGKQVPRPPLMRRIIEATGGEVGVEDLVLAAVAPDPPPAA